MIKVIDDLYTGNNTIHDIYEYKYIDHTYDMKFGLDLILDSHEARESRRLLKAVENQEKVKEREIYNFVQHCAESYDKECKKILNSNQNKERIQMNQKLFNFQNKSSNNVALTRTFKNQKFNVLQMNKKKKKSKHGKEEKPSSTTIDPRYIQIEAALYLGCERISQFSYSNVKIFGQNV